MLNEPEQIRESKMRMMLVHESINIEIEIIGIKT